jgi:ribose transport system ATP-binding protein
MTVVDTAALNVETVSKTFPGQVALDRASIVVKPGRVHALVGQNGSGKSTLIKILAGYHRADEGAVATLLGEPLNLDSGSPGRAERIHVMHQDLGLVNSLNSVENLALGRGFQTGFLGRVRWKQESARATQHLATIGATFDVRVPVGMLTPSERALVALARALEDWDDDGGGLLILDEPTAAMARLDVLRLFEAVRKIRDRGAGVIFVSHRIDEVFEIADDYTVLRDGKVVATGQVADLTHEGLIEAIVGRPLEELATHDHVAEHAGEAVLEVHNLWGDRLEGLNLVVRTGEIVGFAGLVGSGRDELPNLLFGAQHRAAGSVRVKGVEVPEDPHEAICAGMALVPAERKRYGSIGNQTIRENVSLAHLRPLVSKGRLSRQRERTDVLRWTKRVDLRPAEPERLFNTLSGGNQQKAVIARWLRKQPTVLVLDEPTQGVDVGAKSTIYTLLDQAAAEGMGVVVCSSEAEELAAVCDRVIVLSNGRPIAELRGATLSAESIVQQLLR